MNDLVSKYISIDEVLMGRAKLQDLPNEYIENINTLVPAVNDLLELFYIEYPNEPKRKVSSGYRPPKINSKIKGAAKKSNHMTCSAVDLFDSDKKLKNWCIKNLNEVKKRGLYMEHPDYTPTWIHLQIKPTRRNPFIPY